MPDRTFFPWASVIRFGLGHLRLTPDAFWRLSLPELHALLGASQRPATSTRQELEELMALFPDNIGKPDVATAKDPDDGR
jgi:uncharacterized phage protein (TIGR02216 family)